MKDLKDLLKNASLEDLQSLVQQKKQEIKKEAEKDDFFKKVFEIRNFLRGRNLSLNDFQKMKSFFKKSKKAKEKNDNNAKNERMDNIKIAIDLNSITSFGTEKNRFSAKVIEIKNNSRELKTVKFYKKQKELLEKNNGILNSVVISEWDYLQI